MQWSTTGVGSVSELVFALPVLRRVPGRFPRVARYFDLGAEASGAVAPRPANQALVGDAPR